MYSPEEIAAHKRKHITVVPRLRDRSQVQGKVVSQTGWSLTRGGAFCVWRPLDCTCIFVYGGYVPYIICICIVVCMTSNLLKQTYCEQFLQHMFIQTHTIYMYAHNRDASAIFNNVLYLSFTNSPYLRALLQLPALLIKSKTFTLSSNVRIFLLFDIM